MQKSNNQFTMICKHCGCQFSVRPEWKHYKETACNRSCSDYKACRSTNYTRCDEDSTRIICPMCDRYVNIIKYPNDPDRETGVEFGCYKGDDEEDYEDDDDT